VGNMRSDSILERAILHIVFTAL